MSPRTLFSYESPNRPLGAWAIGLGKIHPDFFVEFQERNHRVIVSEPIPIEILNSLELRPSDAGYYHLSYGDLLCKAQMADVYGEKDLLEYSQADCEKYAVKDIWQGLIRHNYDRLYFYSEVEEVVISKIWSLFNNVNPDFETEPL